MATNPIIDVFAAVLREAGFERRSSTWYLRTPEVIVVVNLQRLSPINPPDYGSNVGFWLREVDDTVAYPKVDDCHVYQPGWPQWISTEGDDEEEILSLRRFLDLGKEIPEQERRAYLETWIAQRLLPHLRRGSSLEGLREMGKADALGVFVRNEGVPLLGITIRGD